MLTNDFFQIVNEAPKYITVFKLKKDVPKYMSIRGVKSGDEFYYDKSGSMVHIKTGIAFIVTPSKYTFVEYRKTN